MSGAHVSSTWAGCPLLAVIVGAAFAFMLVAGLGLAVAWLRERARHQQGQAHRDQMITVVLPEFIPARWWQPTAPVPGLDELLGQPHDVRTVVLAQIDVELI